MLWASGIDYMIAISQVTLISYSQNKRRSYLCMAASGICIIAATEESNLLPILSSGRINVSRTDYATDAISPNCGKLRGGCWLCGSASCANQTN